MGTNRTTTRGLVALAALGVAGLVAGNAGAAVQLATGASTSVYDGWNSDLAKFQSHPDVAATVNDHHGQSYTVGVPSVSFQSGGSQEIDDLLYAPDSYTGSQPIKWSVSGSASASGRAEMGALHAYATSTAHLSAMSQSYTYTSTVYPYGTKQVSKYNPLYVGADASVDVAWQDSFTFSSKTLPVGTPVQVQFTLVLDSHIDNDRSIVDYYTRAYAEIYMPSPYGGSTLALLQNEGAGAPYDGDHMVKVVTREFYVGYTGDIGSHMFIEALSGAIAYDPNYGVNQDETTIVNASNTSHFYMDVLTEGVEVTTESGTSYATPAVPEPASVGLLLGLPALLLGRRRR